MTFKEFVAWCNERACDGCWGLIEATLCIDIVQDVRRKPFWRREKYWHETHEEQVVHQIVYPTNQKIRKLFGKIIGSASGERKE